MATMTDDQLKEVGRLGHAVYDRVVRPHLRPEDDYRYVVVDVDHDDYEIGEDLHALTARMLAARPGARLFVMRAGYLTAERIGWAPWKDTR